MAQIICGDGSCGCGCDWFGKKGDRPAQSAPKPAAKPPKRVTLISKAKK